MNSPPLFGHSDRLQQGLVRPQRCARCPFKSKTCGSRGPIDSPFVVVGESPGNNEIAKNEPFVGESGQMLTKMLKECGLDIEPYVTNAFVCLPVNKTSSNVEEASQACSSRLLCEIKAHPRKVILALGNGAVWGLTGDTSHRITNIQGKIFPSELSQQGIVAAVHPAFLLRGGGSQRLFKEHVKLAVDLLRGTVQRKHIVADTILMETETDVRDLVDAASRQDYIAGDIETSDLKYRRGYMLSQGFCWDPKEAYIVPPYLFKFLGQIYDPTIVKARWIWQNGKFDVGWLRHESTRHWNAADYLAWENKHVISKWGFRRGYEYARVDDDTMLLSYAIDESGGIHDLEQLAGGLLGAPDWKDIIDSYRPNKSASYSHIPPNILYKYQGSDLSNTLQIFPILRQKVKADPKLELLYTKTLIPDSEVIVYMEACGNLADRKRMALNRTMWSGFDVPFVGTIGYIPLALAKVNAWSQKVLKKDINPNSWQQVQKLLYVGGLDLAYGKVLGTSKEVFKKLDDHPVLRAIEQYRRQKKILGTYIDGWEERIDNDDRIHPSFSQHKTTTGRLACSDPNVQNAVRIDTIKGQIIAAALHVLLSHDLNQAELRCLACLSKDPVLCAIYEEAKESIHHKVATLYYGATYNEDQYQLAKAITFGIVYGREAYSISIDFDIPVKEAQKYIDGWFGQFPHARDFIYKCRDAPIQGKILQTPFGRKRRFRHVAMDKAHDVGNQAANFPFQSIASDITQHGAIEILDWLKERKIKLTNIVHDDIIKEVKTDLNVLHEVHKHVKTTMEAVPAKWGMTRIPFIADAKFGPRWGYLKKFNSSTNELPPPLDLVA